MKEVDSESANRLPMEMEPKGDARESSSVRVDPLSDRSATRYYDLKGVGVVVDRASPEASPSDFGSWWENANLLEDPWKLLEGAIPSGYGKGMGRMSFNELLLALAD